MDIFDYCKLNSSEEDHKDLMQLKSFFHNSFSLENFVDELVCFSLFQAEFSNSILLAEERNTLLIESALTYTNFPIDNVIFFKDEERFLSCDVKERLLAARKTIVVISSKTDLVKVISLLSLLSLDDLLLITDGSVSKEKIIKSLTQSQFSSYNKKIYAQRGEYSLIAISVSNHRSEEKEIKSVKGVKINNYSNKIKGVELIVNGKNNYIYIDDEVRFGKVVIKIQGDNNFIFIGSSSNLNGKLHIQGSSSYISIGKNVKTTSADTRLFTQENEVSITIGDACLLSKCIFRTSDSHSILDKDTNTRINYASSILLEDNVWIAEDAKILKGTHIAKGSILAAGSTAIGDLSEPFSIYAGLPAKIIKSNITWVEERI